MILTVTLNPALDLTYAVDALIPHATHRVTAVTERPGGKGLNVATVLRALGEDVLATGLLGGATGERVEELLAHEGVPASFRRIAGETRRTVAVADRVDATGFWEPGPSVADPEWRDFVAHFRGLLPSAAVAVLSGSLPCGVPSDAYATLIAIAADAGVPTVLDASGEALRLGLSARPHIAKPNAAEADALLPGVDHRTRAVPMPADDLRPGRRTQDHSAAVPLPADDLRPGRRTRGRYAAEHLLRLGARAVVLSRGALGLLGVTADGAWEVAPVETVAGNSTGAGDACVAALARGLAARTPMGVLLADAVALSAAAVAAPTAGAFDPDAYRRWSHQAAVVTSAP